MSRTPQPRARGGHAGGGADADVIVVGAGHNGLVSAAYLAQAGYRVLVFERRAVVGGAIATEEIVPGYRFDLGGSAHILIRLTPIVEELELNRHGLDYLELDPLFFSPFPDGDQVTFYRDADRTVDAMERSFPGQGEGYRRFLDDWMPFASMVKELFLTTPHPREVGKRIALGKEYGSRWRWALRRILRPYGNVLHEYLSEEKIRAPMEWMAAQSGPPPSARLSAPFLLWHPLYHEGGIARPRGGSGVLAEALARCVEHHGGKVETSAPVESFVTEGGRVCGVRVGGDVYTARATLSGAHASETFLNLLPKELVPSAARRMDTGNGFGAVLRLALDAPVEYAAAPSQLEARTALQLICPTTTDIHDAYADFARGHPSRTPPLVAMTFSAVDSTLAPPGHEVLWLWAQYFPRHLASGEWSKIASAVEDSILNHFEQYAPGTREKIVGSLFEHPEWLERELGLVGGNVMHLEMKLTQMFSLRPFWGASRYRTAIAGLYITGASTHPGGGIMGASGRNAAGVVLEDLSADSTTIASRT